MRSLRQRIEQQIHVPCHVNSGANNHIDWTGTLNHLHYLHSFYILSLFLSKFHIVHLYLLKEYMLSSTAYVLDINSAYNKYLLLVLYRPDAGPDTGETNNDQNQKI